MNNSVSQTPAIVHFSATECKSTITEQHDEKRSRQPAIAEHKASQTLIAPDASRTTELRKITTMPTMGFGTFIKTENPYEIQNGRDKGDQKERTVKAVLNSLNLGMQHVDTADNYKNIKWVGNAIGKAMQSEASGGPALAREALWITHKGAPKSDITASLQALKVSSVDLYLWHQPENFEDEKSVESQWRQMCLLVDLGQAKHIGVSNMYQPHLERLLAICDKNDLRKPHTNEIECHLYAPENDLIAFHRLHNIKTIAYSPLGYCNKSFLTDNGKVKEIAENHKTSPEQVLLAWNIARGVNVIPKSEKAKHIESNLQATKLAKELSDNEIKKLSTAVEENMRLTTTSQEFYDKSKNLSWEVSKREKAAISICKCM